MEGREASKPVSPAPLSPDPAELSSGETEELERIKWHRKQLLEDIQVCAHSQAHGLVSTRAFVPTRPPATATRKQALIHAHAPPVLTPDPGLVREPAPGLSPSPRVVERMEFHGAPHCQGPERARRAGKRGERAKG